MPKKGSWAVQMAVILLMSLILFYGDLQDSEKSIIERTNEFPLYLLFLVIPLVGFIITIVRKNTFPGLRQWMLDNFLKYFAMFLSLIVTTYVVYYVFIIGNPQTWFEWLTTFVTFSSIFIIFLWLKHIEESSDVKLDGKKFVTITKYLGLFFLIIFSFMFGISAFYQFILASSTGLILIGLFQGAMLLAGIPAGMEKELKGKARILIGLGGNAFMLYSILFLEPFRIAFKVSEEATIVTFILYLLLGTGIILIGFLFGHFANEDNIIIKMFNNLSTKPN
jgi:hypothetical protein